MKVLKFGGTSVGSVEGILNLKKIALNEEGNVIVVVSALHSVTDKLVQATALAKEGCEEYGREIDDIVTIHHSLIDVVIPESRRSMLTEELRPLFEDLRGILHGVFLIKDTTPKITDAILSYGERLSSRVVRELIEGSKLYDSRQFIKTEKKDGNITVNYEETNRRVKETFILHKGVAVCPGFIASDIATGVTTTLGRGGSDYTASIIAAAMDANVLEIWTDVDGFMTADPRIIPSAYSIEQLSYGEAMELSNFGAKVIYPPTIYPVRRKNIPIYIKNTFHPEFKGTVINDGARGGKDSVRGLSSINNTSIVNVSGMAMVGVIGVNRRIFSTLADHGISVFMVAQTSSETSTSICMTPEDAVKACKVLNDEFSKEISTGAMNPMLRIDGLSTIAIVGEQMRRTSGTAGRLFSVLGRNGVSVIALAQGASEMNISVIVDQRQLRKALNVIHDSFFLSDYQVVNIFLCGTGSVGSSLLQQIEEQQSLLMSKRRLRLNIAGIANSRHAIFNRDGIDLKTYEEQLANSDPSDWRRLRDEVIGMNLYNSVFVDCTAEAEIAGLYQNFLDHNISVVAANKIAASSDYSIYEKLRKTALKRGVKFLYETNVGAGLPIIKTINDLCDSGDEIVEIQAILSGTLNFIFNRLSADCPLSKVIAMAREAHISEPDPRVDLCGKDVLRKLVILIREAGFTINQEDVELDSFIPAHYFEGSTDDFMSRIHELDAEFEERRSRMEQEGKHLRYIARWSEGKASVSLCEVERSHPFYELADSNNVVLLTTKRYNRYPMIIQGYGAGKEVTAAGVFADIMRVANI